MSAHDRAADTIAAIATPRGYGGIGVVRISGVLTRDIANAILGDIPLPRHARLSWFRDDGGDVIDQGLAIFFPAPHSFTGEDVLELQGHGGPVVMDLLLNRLIQLGARLAHPGEFSERAFLNGKFDLTQAEAIADLITSGTETAARMAGRTLSGDFSRQVCVLVEGLINLRTFVEAVLDFPDEEIDLIDTANIVKDLEQILGHLNRLLVGARQGSLMREGIVVVIAGSPNAGKSSLLNALSGTDAAIVTEVPGTTRDLLHRDIQIDGLPVHLIDTAGFRHSVDLVELEGIRRARDQIHMADAVLWLCDDSLDPQALEYDPADLPKQIPITMVRNKIDLSGRPPGICNSPQGAEIAISARLGTGLDYLRSHLKEVAGFVDMTEGVFLARRRHIEALGRAQKNLLAARRCLQELGFPDIIAEELRLAQQSLGEITGKFTSEDLLERIFSSFCIGK